MGWPKGVPRKPRETIEGVAIAAPFSMQQEVQTMNDEAPKKSATIEVEVLRDYWDETGERHRASWDEPTNEIERDENGKQRIKMIKHDAAVINVPRAEAKKGIEAGYFRVAL